MTMPLSRKVPYVTKEKITLTQFRGSSADAHPCISLYTDDKIAALYILYIKWLQSDQFLLRTSLTT